MSEPKPSAEAMDIHDAAWKRAVSGQHTDLRNEMALAIDAAVKAERQRGENLADEVAVLVRRKVVDSRSPVADALLDFREPPSSPRADRLAEAAEEKVRAVRDREREIAGLVEKLRISKEVETALRVTHREHCGLEYCELLRLEDGHARLHADIASRATPEKPPAEKEK